VRDEAETLERNPGGLTLAYDTREHALGLGYLLFRGGEEETVGRSGEDAGGRPI
jgi:hypothetical protein